MINSENKTIRSNQQLEFYKKFIFDALLPPEKTALRNGLKLFHLTFDNFLAGGYELIDEQKGFDIFKIPSSEHANKFATQKVISKIDQKIREEFLIVLVRIIFIVFQRLIDNNEKLHAIDYGAFALDTIDKIKGRFPDVNHSLYDGLVQQISNGIIKLQISILEEVELQEGQQNQLIKQDDSDYKNPPPITYDYWNFSEKLLNELEELLLKYDFIEPHPNFKSPFISSRKIVPDSEKIIWKKSFNEAFYLLFTILNGEFTKTGEKIDSVSSKIFFFKDKQNNSNNISSNYRKFGKHLKKINVYSEKKLKIIKSLISEINFPSEQ
ncbi:MAG TPA: hypothetical protein VN026_06505 [Bacteroidia bacterium]|nr:hypothetical protein [Bacteroidia bacterium]